MIHIDMMLMKTFPNYFFSEHPYFPAFAAVSLQWPKIKRKENLIQLHSD